MAFVSPTALPIPPHTDGCSITNSLSPRIVTSSLHTPPSSFSPSRQLARLRQALVTLDLLTRPGRPSSSERYEALPAHVKTPSQMLGRLSPGCEGTQGVFPKCNFACTPCYHSEHSNAVRVDGFHTVTEVARQMELLQKLRGPTGHCQLIGGEVSLLPPEDHAIALQTMRFYGRAPMSFTHGDFDYDYLRRLVTLPSGRPRFSRIDFAVHFDIGMRGRRGVPKNLTEEKQLSPHRRSFIDMFRRLKREHGVHFYLAHNLTVTPQNLPTLAPAVRDLMSMGYRLISFQPAAAQGASARRVNDTLSISANHGDSVWKAIEDGLGISLPYSLFQMGDPRCNRMSLCGVVGLRNKKHQPLHFFPVFDDRCPADEHARDLVMKHVGNIVLPSRLFTIKLLRIFIRRPWLLYHFLSWVVRCVRRAGGLIALITRGLHLTTVVMHRFMDADDVSVAWQLMENKISPDHPDVSRHGPRIRETMERLAACSYGMARPQENRVVPACVQHSVYDTVDNRKLAKDLPLSKPPRPASEVAIQVQETPFS